MSLSSGEGCLFPPEWTGSWFQRGVYGSIKITPHEISGKGFCKEITADFVNKVAAVLIENRSVSEDDMLCWSTTTGHSFCQILVCYVCWWFLRETNVCFSSWMTCAFFFFIIKEMLRKRGRYYTKEWASRGQANKYLKNGREEETCEERWRAFKRQNVQRLHFEWQVK